MQLVEYRPVGSGMDPTPERVVWELDDNGFLEPTESERLDEAPEEFHLECSCGMRLESWEAAYAHIDYQNPAAEAAPRRSWPDVERHEFEEGDVDPSHDWRARAAELSEHGIPERRAQVVALIDAGRTHREAADELGLENRSEVSTHVKLYREKDLPNAQWIAEHAPEI